MDNYRIELSNDEYQSVDLVLQSVTIKLTLKWNWVSSSWLYDMESANWNVYGKRLTNNTNMLRHTPQKGFLSVIGQCITKDNLGVENQLYYREVL